MAERLPLTPPPSSVGRPAPLRVSADALPELLSRPTPGVIETLRALPGDVLVLGAGGKMGPSLATMVRRAMDALGRRDRVIAVSRFSSRDAAAALSEAGVETMACDLLDRAAVQKLPDAPHVIFMAGQKFGTTDAPWRTWAMNTLVPAIAAERYRGSRMVAFSTGNVYPLTPAPGRGSDEHSALGPVGEYAASCLGRERVLEYAAAAHGLRLAIVRLNYAHDLRYGVITDVARAIWEGRPVSLRMGYANVIWQGDANARAIQCLNHAASPPFVVNVTGLEAISIRDIARQLGVQLDREVLFEGTEAPDALLSDATQSAELFGAPETSVPTLVAWVAEWTRRGSPTLGKPTHFETRDGAF